MNVGLEKREGKHIHQLCVFHFSGRGVARAIYQIREIGNSLTSDKGTEQSSKCIRKRWASLQILPWKGEPPFYSRLATVGRTGLHSLNEKEPSRWSNSWRVVDHWQQPSLQLWWRTFERALPFCNNNFLVCEGESRRTKTEWIDCNNKMLIKFWCRVVYQNYLHPLQETTWFENVQNTHKSLVGR